MDVRDKMAEALGVLAVQEQEPPSVECPQCGGAGRVSWLTNPPDPASEVDERCGLCHEQGTVYAPVAADWLDSQNPSRFAPKADVPVTSADFAPHGCEPVDADEPF